MNRADFPELVTCLNGDRSPRVWSLLVTLFGDLAQEDGARISGTLLRHLGHLIGLKPEAVRVALHRLRKEGWIDSLRQGRNSDYMLTDWGRAQSRAASPRIYATGPLADRAWLAVFEPGGDTPRAGERGAWLTSNLLLTAQPDLAADAFLAEVTAPLPGWMRRKLCDAETEGRARHLLSALDRIGRDAALANRLDPAQSAALRLQIVHDWRRIALKSPLLPDSVFPEDWPVPPCRARVAEVLHRLPRQDLHVLARALPP